MKTKLSIEGQTLVYGRHLKCEVCNKRNITVDIRQVPVYYGNGYVKTEYQQKCEDCCENSNWNDG